MNNIRLLLTIMLLVALISVPAWANQENVKISINGETLLLEDKPILASGRTLVPLRVISENLGGLVNWNGDSKVVAITFAGKNILIPIDSKEVQVNGVTLTIDVPAKIVNNRTDSNLVQLNYIFKSKIRELRTFELPEYFYLRETVPSENNDNVSGFLVNLMFLPLK